MRHWPDSKDFRENDVRELTSEVMGREQVRPAPAWLVPLTVAIAPNDRESFC